MAETKRGSKFEKDFIERTYSSIVSDVSIAFSELVANSWDAGATSVSITLPNKKNGEIIIEDNGSGMTDAEFQQRWMTIAYNRVAHQGEFIEYASYEIPEGEKNTARNGIAFWSGSRLVGNPSWYIGSTRVEDARRKFALRHLIIVEADGLINDVYYDWSRYDYTEPVKEVYTAVIKFVRAYRVEYYKGKVAEVKDDAIRRNQDSIETLSIPSLYDLNNFFEYYLEQRPEVDSEELNIIVSALVSVLQSRNGMSLLEKLAGMDVEDMDSLNDILEKWSVSDIRTVLDEIDQRIKVISAIEQLCSDPKTDELHILHPLISQAKWLFGVEFDNLNYTFNRSLSTVLKTILQGQRKANIDINWSKRPDLVIGDDFSLSSVCTEDADENGIFVIDRILIIELKRGGFTIGRTEISQAEEYVDVLYKGNKLNCKPKIKAFVVGDSVSPTISVKKGQEDYGEVYAYTYNQLVKTAEKRLFNLKEKLIARYHQLNAKDYLSDILGDYKQTELKLS